MKGAATAQTCFGRGLSRLPGLSSAIIIAAGILVLVGWTLDIRGLILLLPAMVSMNPVTAFTFILAGVSLWCLGARYSRLAPERRNLGIGLAVVVALVGALKLLDYLVPLNFHIDQLFFARKLAQPGLYPPNEMAPNTALNFLLCGLALLCFEKDHGPELLPVSIIHNTRSCYCRPSPHRLQLSRTDLLSPGDDSAHVH